MFSGIRRSKRSSIKLRVVRILEEESNREDWGSEDWHEIARSNGMDSSLWLLLVESIKRSRFWFSGFWLLILLVNSSSDGVVCSVGVSGARMFEEANMSSSSRLSERIVSRLLCSGWLTGGGLCQ